jgi:cholesterol oxidase
VFERRTVDRLSTDVAELAPHYEVVVVGSGYGGAIAACRLSRAGRSVAVLERGREMHPGEYPSRLTEAAAHVQVTGPGLGANEQKGDRRNLYWFHTGASMNVFSGCGLGGTSLVNAGVSLEPDPRVFLDERWPAGLRRDVGSSLADGYIAADHMLVPRQYPATFPHLAKIDALRVAAGGDPISPTPINVTFDSGPNVIGIDQPACVGCGDCVTGCNTGAKNTVLMNYLPDASAHGTSIFTEMDVRTIELDPRGEGWVVHVQPLGFGRDEEFTAPPIALSADLVVLAAGTVGTTGILLRSAAKGLSLSGQVGRRFTGNGDILGFAQRPHTTVRGIGAGHCPPEPSNPPGPCITAFIDRRKGSVEEGVIIEDAVIPGLLAKVVAADLVAQFGARDESIPQCIKAGLAGLSSFLRGGREGATEHLQTFLLMGHDGGEGRLVLEDDDVAIEWPDVGTSDFYRRADSILAGLAEEGGGTYIEDPLSSHLLHQSLVTVHPLGGCIMADGAQHGVVDHRGRVFSSSQGTAVYQNLVVADGSIVPMPLGVNPLLTISALAERSMEILCAERDWASQPRKVVPVHRPPPASQEHPGLRLTERMSGWWAEESSPDRGSVAPFLAAESRSEHTTHGRLEFVLTLISEDVELLLSDLDTSFDAVGTVTAPRLSTEPLTVEGGHFQLLVGDDPDPAVRHMRYHLPLLAVSGERYFLEGFKTVAPGALGELWGATSTLYVTLRGSDSAGPVIGRGVLRIRPEDFVRQLRTIETTGPIGMEQRLAIEAELAFKFAGPLAHDYGSVIHRTTSFNPTAPARRQRALRVPPPQIHEYRTSDGLTLRLTRYQGGASDPVLLSHGMGNPLTWSLDTVDVTMVEFLVAHGYDVWLQEWRSSTLLPTSRTQFNGDQVAQYDHPSAAAAIAGLSGRSDLHVVAHCVGSITWLMATLAGNVEPSSLFCSAVGAHPIAPTLTRLKVGMHLGEMLHRLGIQLLTTSSTTNEWFLQRLFDRELRLYPIPAEEECDQAVCRRVAFIYGNGVRHVNLNPATHEALHELFGPTNLTMMDHLSAMARAKRIRSATGAFDYLDHLERLQLPISFASGAHNLVWLPDSTERTYKLLDGQFGGKHYHRYVYPNYGHQDVFNGALAYKDTFPSVVEHLRRAGA